MGSRSWMRWALVVAVGAPFALGGMVSSASPLRTATLAGGRETKLHFTTRVVHLARSLVAKNLVGVSSDGTFTFKRTAGPLSSLKVGKVMLLEGSDALLVTKVQHSRGRLVIRTRPAQLTDVISSGHISFAGKPDLRKGFIARLTGSPVAHKASDLSTAGYPYIGPAPGRQTATAASTGTFSAQGTYGPIGFVLAFEPVSQTRVNLSGTICVGWGATCSNGPSTGVSAKVEVSGYIDVGEDDVGIDVSGGRITDSVFSIKHLAGHMTLKYVIARGEGDMGHNPPILHIPLGFDFPVVVSGVPLYFKLQTGIEFRLGVSSKNAVIRGGADVSTSGSDQLEQSGRSVSASASGDQADVTVLDSENGGTGPSISAAPSGTVVAVQFPKIGMGLGTRAINGIGYVDLVTAVGQTTGSAFGGMFCSSYDVFFTIGAGLEAQVGPLGYSSPKKELFNKEKKVAEPGCG